MLCLRWLFLPLHNFLYGAFEFNNFIKKDKGFMLDISFKALEYILKFSIENDIFYKASFDNNELQIKKIRLKTRFIAVQR